MQQNMAATIEEKTSSPPLACAPSSCEFAIPVIDISGYLLSNPATVPSIVKAIRLAAISPGFFQITGHSVSTDLRDRLFAALKIFFAVPQSTKTSVHRNNSSCMRGYEAVGDQMLEKGIFDRKEGFMIGQELVGSGNDGLGGLRFGQGPNQWPTESTCPGFRTVMEEYFEEMRLLSRTVFRLVALSLGLEEKFFDNFVYNRDSITMCRAHRYPPITTSVSETTDIKPRGIGAHTDFGAMTLLLQDGVGGLEVFHRPTATWHPVTPILDAYVVNIGDMMERWTNDKYTSTLHRALSPVSKQDRYSVAFFNEGLLDQVVECISTCLEPGEKPKYEPVTVEDHLRMRYGSSY
ncbi:putative gibberellin 20 oxidase [Podospora didyma]|uniref:Gibberellin 20 oxidase n=1 Tax=Podospora didyma TaxID=330526 RepID=A0AAE0NGK6_9PEZI|nr:putative gibberellin 20 oxidase [Podospora didyma]